MARTPLMVANWKMNKTTAEAASLTTDIVMDLKASHLKDIELVICPPFTDIRTVSTVLEFEHSHIQLGAQDVYWQDDGAYTGSISARMLAEIGCRYCIVGHSERRQYFKETDREISLKMVALAAHDVIPILCVGESARVRASGARVAGAFVMQQLEAALVGFLRDAPGAEFVVAYEPIWSIGTGNTATPNASQSMARAIRRQLAALATADVAERTRILYGGSLAYTNIALFAATADIDGGLVGGSSLVAEDFSRLVKNFAATVRGETIEEY